LLIESGADVTAIDHTMRTPLHWAAQQGHPKLACFLINSGANVDARDERRATPLHLAAIKGRTKIAGLLIAKGAEVDALDDHHATPLHSAVEASREATLRLLIAAGADVNFCKTSALHISSIPGHVTIARALIENGAELDARDATGPSCGRT
jgi:ankyrin repeat protein